MGAVGCGGTAGGGGGGSGGGGGAWEGPAACPVCLKVLSNKYNLRTHMEDKHSPLQHVFPCPICQHVYKTRNSLHNHFSMRHRGLKMPKISCRKKSSAQEPEEEKLILMCVGGVLVDNKPKWQCPVCYKLLSTRSNLKIHVQDKHSSLQHAFPCPVCGHVYKTRNSLHNHMSIRHRGVRMPPPPPHPLP
ncbi:REH2-associated factor 1-like [Penaeus indicus]|uniref:REH2-associated factor 1-like n=1 Tax=Penaeus indicus TaxID=29960 RepID=UPI00300C23BA